MIKSQSHSWAANEGPNNLSCSSLHSCPLSGWTDQCNLIKLKSLVPSSAPIQVLWKKLPTPFGVEITKALPPVASVCCDAPHIVSILSINAASSIINKDKASERPDSSELATALIWEPFLYRNDNLLSSTQGCFNQPGKLACITLTFVTKFFAVSCFVAMTKIFLSCWNVIIHKAYPAVNVDKPNCLAFNTIL